MLFVFFLVYIPIQGQNTDKEIKKLSDKKQKLLLEIEAIRNKVDAIDIKIASLKPKKSTHIISDSSIYGFALDGCVLRRKPDALSDKLLSFKGRTKIKIIDFIPPKYYKVCSGSLCGYVFDFFIEENAKMKDLKNRKLKDEKLKKKETKEAIRINQDKINAITKRKRDSINKVSKERYELLEKERKIEFEKKKIIIADYRISINSANGVNFKILWGYFNKSKIIKYIYFTVVPYNDVGDIQTGEVRDHSSFTGQITGPIIAADRFFYSEWETAWYNNTITCLKITKVRVIYTDGTSYTYAKELPDILDSDFSNDCSY